MTYPLQVENSADSPPHDVHPAIGEALTYLSTYVRQRYLIDSAPRTASAQKPPELHGERIYRRNLCICNMGGRYNQARKRKPYPKALVLF